MTRPAFLAVDWGTTNLRCWVVDETGAPGPRRDFPLGVGRLAHPGEPAQRFHDEVRPAMKAEGLPTVMAGMIGSTLGWREAPYLDCPVDADALAAALVRVEGEEPPVAIARGLRCSRDGQLDVMRGEETQVLGWIEADPARSQGRHLICHPGTHAKWVEVEDGKVVRFVTAMTGELYSLLSTQSVLRTEEDAVDDDEAFDKGLAAVGDGAALVSLLFGVRANVVGGDLRPRSAMSYLSGLLVGADVASSPALIGFGPQTPVTLIGEAALCERYARALSKRGAPVERFSGDEAVLSGLKALYARGGFA